jgi:hypothetical protein
MARTVASPAPTCHVATALQRLRRHTPMQSAAALSEWLLIDICRATHRTQFDERLGKENMGNVTSRKRVEAAVFKKAVDEKNEAQQCCAYLREENASLRRSVKKQKCEKKEVKRALLLQKRKTKEMRKKAVCAPRQACSRPLVRASRDRSSVCVL